MKTKENKQTKAADTIQSYFDRGDLMRGLWDDPGKDRACLLAAMAPIVGKTRNAKDCPADIIPQWLASITIWIDDCGTEPKWKGVIGRYVDLLRRSGSLTDKQWARAELRCRMALLRVTAPYINCKQCFNVTSNVIAKAVREGWFDASQADNYNMLCRTINADRTIGHESFSRLLSCLLVNPSAYEDRDRPSPLMEAITSAAFLLRGNGRVDIVMDSILDAWQEEVRHSESPAS